MKPGRGQKEAAVTGSGLRFPGETVLRTQEPQESREGRTGLDLCF